ncbi:DUF1294 domain-containing protein [Pseudoalteromonas denitrificans]|uniref:Uncharacterized membrane protein YsdA, DUF1294 family n=1 Tax=Pseudoalteromonas denitrificans DSM 6059 TaxID=1123010 RepID=A0A1I1JAZ0_9GAMM|nr:cold shock and DUF1294 domain-containing protein [Pseudoalteromonas denitrificans]SFC42600.1 Uncharacterized membrane protein YsdA, DUF1294 family [Pseudoalteromonas denitrificans DSM 6059]
MRLDGRIISWNNKKGFGFIAPNCGGKNVFIHKNSLVNRDRTPKFQDSICFSIRKDNQGRYCACDVLFSGEKYQKRKINKQNKFTLFFTITFFIVITIAGFLGKVPINLIHFYFGLSFITFIVYAIDKIKAQKGKWRTPESTLHILALIGGWPGATFAQQLLRHKSKKQVFQIKFWFCVLTNCAALAWLLSPYGIHTLIFISFY